MNLIKINIAFCVKNLARGTEKARQELIKEPDMNVSEYGCTSNCGICTKYHVAVVNGKPIKALTPEELVDNVNDYIDNELIDQL